MVLEIRLSNFFSIKDEVVLDMQAASIQTKKAKELEENTFVCGNERLLKTVAIYGANASGKSSVIKAIRACVGMIFSSHNYTFNSGRCTIAAKFITASNPENASTGISRNAFTTISFSYPVGLRL